MVIHVWNLSNSLQYFQREETYVEWRFICIQFLKHINLTPQLSHTFEHVVVIQCTPEYGLQI